MPAVQDVKDSSGQPIDREFNKTFWSLQVAFQLPYSIIEPCDWVTVTSSIHNSL